MIQATKGVAGWFYGELMEHLGFLRAYANQTAKGEAKATAINAVFSNAATNLNT